MDNKIEELQAEAINAATEHIKSQRKMYENTRIKLFCVTILLILTIICATIISCFAIFAQQKTIIEQQYSLNMQYAGLIDYVSGAEIVTETADSADGGTAIVGDGNMLAGGDVNNGYCG